MIFIHKNPRQSCAPLQIWGNSPESCFSNSDLKVKSVSTQWTVYTGEASHSARGVQAVCKTGKRWRRSPALLLRWPG